MTRSPSFSSIRSFLVALVAILATGLPAEAQSLLSVEGAGLPVAGVDARVRAMGGVGIGLLGPQLLGTDPAAAADLVVPVVAFASETARVGVTEGDVDGDFTTTRFPLFGVSYPVEGVGVFSATFSSVLDQSWENRQADTLPLGGSGGEAFITDRFSSQGGVSALEVGVARRIGDVAIGVRVGRHIGSVDRILTRVFDSLTVGTAPEPFRTGGTWRYSGLTGSVGLSTRIGEVGRAAASVRFGGEVDATPSDDTDAPPATLAVPAEFRLGGSAFLAPELSAALGVEFADWSDADETGRTGWAVGGGVEWTGSSFLGKDAAFRLGARRAALPFVPVDADGATETLLNGGLGLDLLSREGAVLAAFDLALEFGRRSFGTTTENLFRTSISVRLGGT